MDWLTVLILGSVTALATGLGALPFFFTARIASHWLGLANALAAGLMLAASLSLIQEGVMLSAWRVAAGAVAGLLFIIVSRWLIHDRHPLKLEGISAEDTFKILLIMVVMTVHSMTEGIGVGVSFAGGTPLGVYITTAIAIHNIPEGLAISLVMVPRGVTAWKAMGWSVFSSLPQPILAVPAFLFVLVFEPFLPVGLGFAAGAMIWMVARELIPDALKDSPPVPVAAVTVLSAAGMFMLTGLLPH